MIKSVSENELEICLDVMKTAYKDSHARAGFPGRGRSNYSYEDLLSEFKNGDMLFMKQNGSKVIAMCRIKLLGSNTCKLKDIAVLPEFQKHGYGQELIDFIKAKARELGSTRIELGMYDDNSALKHWYEKNNFISAGTKTYPDSPYIIRIMECKLQPIS